MTESNEGNVRLNEMLDGLTGREIVCMMREMPTKCDACEKEYPPEDLDPVSGGEWICHPCWEAECKAFNEKYRTV